MGYFLFGIILMLTAGICPAADLPVAGDDVFTSAVKTLQKKGVAQENDGMLILKRYQHYLSEIAQGNAYGYWGVAGGKKVPPVYDFIAFSVMCYKGTVDRIVSNTIAGKDAFEGMTGFLERAYVSVADKSIDSYLMYVPAGYDKSRAYPLVVMLHGTGEGAFLPVTSPAHQQFLEACEKHGFILVAPNGRNLADKDSPKPNFGASLYMNDGEQDVLQVINLVRKACRIDSSRIYLTGESMGGWGAWYLGSRHPDLFAAIAPVCGWGIGAFKDLKSPPVDLAGLKNMPVYAFHGDKDPVVPASETRKMVASLKAMSTAEVLYEELPGVEHNAQDFVYSNDRVFKWFLRHRR
jgi:poly(3-hydroxybutyrate) depolymerase